MATFDQFLSSIDRSNTKIQGDQFEDFCKWFLENDTYWKSQVKKVWHFDVNCPHAWNDGEDLGTDLIFEHQNGEIWAVQAKCYDQDYPVTKKDIDSFLSDSNRKEISGRLLMASTDNIGPNARKVCAAQEKRVTFCLYSDFVESDIDYPESVFKIKKAVYLKKPKPELHQSEAIDNVMKGFEKYDRGQLIMACGTGKTFTTLWIKEKLNPKSTLVLLPSLNLLSQTLKAWVFASKKQFFSIAICSDETVTKDDEDSSIQKIQDLSFPVTTDLKEISSFLLSNDEKVVFCTYQSSHLIEIAMKNKEISEFDLVVCDEAHRCAGKPGKKFTTILDDKKIRTKRKLFTTATPRIYSTNVKRAFESQGYEIYGMDDESVFGPVFHKFSFSAAINNKPPLLTDYQVIVIGIDDTLIHELITDRQLLELTSEEIIDSESLATHIGILKALKKYGLKRVLTFHNTVSRAKSFSTVLKKINDFLPSETRPTGLLATDYVSGLMPTNKRKKMLNQLRNLDDCDIRVLSNARCLSEGVDVPAIDGIGIIDPRRSEIDVVQTVGRAIRLSDHKQIGTIVIPVFINSTQDPEEAANQTNFKTVFDVLKALKSHDDELSFILDELKTSLGRKLKSTAPSRKIPKLTIDLPSALDYRFAEHIETLILENSSENWNFYYGLLLDFYEQFGHTIVEQKYAVTIKNKVYQLGSWVADQRKNFKKNVKITEERIKKLNAINFVWSALDERWQKGYRSLLKFYKINKHCRVNQKYKDEDNYALGDWVSKQRLSYKLLKEGKKKWLTEEQISLLNKIDFIWDAAPKRTSILVMKNYLDAFYEKNGECDVPHDFICSDGFELGKEVTAFRSAKFKDRLSKDEIDQLNKSHFVWDSIEFKWERGFLTLVKFIDEHGLDQFRTNTITKDIYKPSIDYKLGAWVNRQQKHFKNNKLQPDKKKKLEKLGIKFKK